MPRHLSLGEARYELTKTRAAEAHTFGVLPGRSPSYPERIMQTASTRARARLARFSARLEIARRTPPPTAIETARYGARSMVDRARTLHRASGSENGEFSRNVDFRSKRLKNARNTNVIIIYNARR